MNSLYFIYTNEMAAAVEFPIGGKPCLHSQTAALEIASKWKGFDLSRVTDLAPIGVGECLVG